MMADSSPPRSGGERFEMQAVAGSSPFFARFHHPAIIGIGSHSVVFRVCVDNVTYALRYSTIHHRARRHIQQSLDHPTLFAPIVAYSFMDHPVSLSQLFDPLNTELMRRHIQKPLFAETAIAVKDKHMVMRQKTALTLMSWVPFSLPRPMRPTLQKTVHEAVDTLADLESKKPVAPRDEWRLESEGSCRPVLVDCIDLFPASKQDVRSWVQHLKENLM